MAHHLNRDSRGTTPPRRTKIESHIPRHLLDNLPHKRGPLAQVTFRPGDAGLDFAGLGFLSIPNITLVNQIRLQSSNHRLSVLRQERDDIRGRGSDRPRFRFALSPWWVVLSLDVVGDGN